MTADASTKSSFLYSSVTLLALLVCFAGMIVPVMEIDGAVYAEISREMYRSGNLFELYLKGRDWLDKPHFQFWATALSFSMFGISSFSYKLPAVLFMALGVYYTYRFGKYFYSAKHGLLAALLLMSAQHIITSNSDVRAEPYLTGLTIFALYYLAVFLRERKFWQMLLGALGLACLLMTKGLFTVIPVGSGLGLAMIYGKQWKSILHWQWLAIVGLTLLLTTPTLYGYYIQFDTRPEKVIFGEQNVSGIKFFLWDSQWGRFTNTGPIKGSGDPFFFFHTLLWAYLPWAFLAYFALFVKAKALIKRSDFGENYTFFGFIFLFIVFNLSSFQLPHYLNALFPFLSIVTAQVIIGFTNHPRFMKVFTPIQIGSSILLFIALFLIHIIFSLTPIPLDVYAVFVLGMGLIVLLWRKKGDPLRRIVFVPAVTVLLVNYYLNRSFYPELLTYQSESEAAFYVKVSGLDPDKLITLGVREEMISFLTDRIVPGLNLEEAKPSDFTNKTVFTDQAGLEKMEQLGLKFKKIEAFPDFRITVLNGTFFNKKTRAQAVEMKYLAEIK